MDKVKSAFEKVAAGYEWAAGYVASYPKIALGVIVGLAVAALL